MSEDRKAAILIGEIESFVGRQMSAEFNENASTGYIWSCDPCEGVKVTSAIIPPDPKDMAIGSGATRKFTMVAEKPGDYTLIFRHVRPWKGGDTAEVYRMNLKIAP